MIDLTDDPRIVALDMMLAKRMAEVLHTHYPDHLWAVTCEGAQGIASVRNLRLSGNWGFVLKIKDFQDDPALKPVIRAGGELLERYRISRGRFKAQEFDRELIACHG
jgi:hypothetical protein